MANIKNVPTVSTVTLTAGQKAAATRARNQRAALLSARANKAAATRRANAAQTAVSAVATA